MRISRIYIPTAINEKDNSEIVLDGSTSNYLINVLRLQIGNSLILFDGKIKGEFNAEIIALANKKVVVKISKFISQNKESPLLIHLAQGISRGEKMDYTIQKAVELGVNSITPLFTEYCNVKLLGDRLDNRLAHWQKIAISACEQSGRCIVPKILPAEHINHWLQSSMPRGECIFLDHRAKQSFKDKTQNKSFNEYTLIIGPEGGLSEEERQKLKQHNFNGVKLGPRVLRTETAALVAISVIQNLYGDI